jgi:hypothetical protein
VAEADSTTSRFVTLSQAAQQLGFEELEFLLVEERLQARQWNDLLDFENIWRRREWFSLNGVHRDHLEAVRAAVQGAPIPGRSWRRWYAMGIVNPHSDRVILEFPDRAVIFQPQVLSTDVRWHQRRLTENASAAGNRRASPPTPALPSQSSSPKKRKAPQQDRVKRALKKLYPPNGSVPEQISTEEVRGKVAAELEGENRQYGLADPSWETVARAIGRGRKT